MSLTIAVTAQFSTVPAAQLVMQHKSEQHRSSPPTDFPAQRRLRAVAAMGCNGCQAAAKPNGSYAAPIRYSSRWMQLPYALPQSNQIGQQLAQRRSDFGCIEKVIRDSSRGHKESEIAGYSTKPHRPKLLHNTCFIRPVRSAIVAL